MSPCEFWDTYVSSSNRFYGIQDYCYRHQLNISRRLECPSHCRAAPGSQTPSWRPPETSLDTLLRLRSLCEDQSILDRWHLGEGSEVGVGAWQVS